MHAHTHARTPASQPASQRPPLEDLGLFGGERSRRWLQTGEGKGAAEEREEASVVNKWRATCSSDGNTEELHLKCV